MAANLTLLQPYAFGRDSGRWCRSLLPPLRGPPPMKTVPVFGGRHIMSVLKLTSPLKTVPVFGGNAVNLRGNEVFSMRPHPGGSCHRRTERSRDDWGRTRHVKFGSPPQADGCKPDVITAVRLRQRFRALVPQSPSTTSWSPSHEDRSGLRRQCCQLKRKRGFLNEAPSGRGLSSENGTFS